MAVQWSQPKFFPLWTYLSWLGLFIHNYVESVDGSTIAVGAISAGLFLLWWRIPARRHLAIRLLLALGLLQLIGAIVTVIPFSFLPFSPQQMTTHYLAHVVYGVMQLPLIAAATHKMPLD